MIYVVKTLKSDVTCEMLFNVVNICAEMFLTLLNNVILRNCYFNEGYKIYVICGRGHLHIPK